MRCVPLLKRWGFATSLLALSLLTIGTAHAQSEPGDDYKTPERQFIDPLGISIQEGMIVRNVTPLTIGDPSAGGLAWTYHGHGSTLYGDYAGSISPGIWPTETIVHFGETQIPFEFGTSYVNGAGNSATLSGSGGNYIYTDTDGTVYIFTGYALASILHPDGFKVTVNGLTGSGDVSAVTNTGFAFKFSGGGTGGTISAVNMLAHTCDTQALSCDAYDSSATLGGWTHTSDPDITGQGGHFAVTDAMGNAWKYLWFFSYVIHNPHDPEDTERGPGVVWAYKDPAGVLQQINYDSSGILASLTDPRGTFTYNSTGVVTDPSSATIYSTCAAGVSVCTKDGLNRQTTHSIALYNTDTIPSSGYPLGVYTRILSVTKPEGDYLTYSYDSRGNVVSTVATPKPGMGSAITVYQASYPSSCTSLITCNKPTWTKDANGNETDYTYDSTHGGVLTVTLPADQNSLRRKTFNTYTAYNTGYGTIYRLTRTETCGLTATQLSTLTSCPSDANTSVTTTDYGTSTTAPYTYKSFMPYSVTQTDKSTSPLVATTTYTYDVMGNVVAVNGPRTDVDDTSYKTYDADRRVVCEIGVDPDGTTTTLSRAMVRHVYSNIQEVETDTGYGTSTTDCTPGSGMATLSARTLMIYDSDGRLVKTEAVLP